MFQSITNFFQEHYTLLLIGFFIISGGYLVVTEFWYFGTAQFYVSEKNTIIKIEKSGEFLCEKKTCSQEIIPGKYRFSVEKENFESFFGEIEIKMQEISEEKIVLKLKSTQLSSNRGGIQKKKMFQKFSEISNISENQKIIENLGFSISDNGDVLQYKNTIIKSLHTVQNGRILYDPTENSTVLVSSDEVGRGYWIITPEKIQLFNPKTQNISTHIQKKTSTTKSRTQEISGFLSLQDGSFITEISGKQKGNTVFLWKPFEQPEQALNIQPFSLGAVCVSGTSGENFMYLENIDENNSEVEAKKINIKTGKIQSWGILENFPLNDFHSMQCIGHGKIVIFFHKNPPLTVERS